MPTDDTATAAGPRADSGPAPAATSGRVLDDEWDDGPSASDGQNDNQDTDPAASGTTVTKTRDRTAFLLTDRDREFLMFLGRYRYATRLQLCLRFGVTDNAIRKRLPRLAKAKYLVRKSVIQGAHGVYVPTEKGMRIAGLDLTAPTFSSGTATHTLGLVDLAIQFEMEGRTVISEREIRAADTRGVTGRPGSRSPAADGKPTYSVFLGGNRVFSHIPDMVLVEPPDEQGRPRTVAVELELVRKTPAEWRSILRGYRDAPHIGQVLYFTHLHTTIAKPLAEIAEDLGLGDLVKVRRFVPSKSVPLLD